MASSLYVWYRVTGEAGEAETAIRSMLARLACRTGVAGRLLKKLDEPGLWMEVYEGIGDRAGFLPRLAQAADEFDVAMFIDGNRREEWFAEDTSRAGPACAAR